MLKFFTCSLTKQFWAPTVCQGQGQRLGHQGEQNIESVLMELKDWTRGVKLIFTRGHISFAVAFKGLNVLGLCKCNYSLTVKRELGAATG